MMYVHGELSERFKELVLKTSDSERNLGFESLTLRQKKHTFVYLDKCVLFSTKFALRASEIASL